ncbi:MAG TPA: glycosyltransferase [Chitinophagaceae bacterium]|nr:glycosyltransferase [Chitinophagaceae bacterium]
MQADKIYWLLTSEFPPQHGGGISTYCLQTATMLGGRGYAVTVFTQDFRLRVPSQAESHGGYRLVRFNPDRVPGGECLGYEARLSHAFARVVGDYMERESVPDCLEDQEYMGIAYYLLQYKHLRYPLFRDMKVLITLHSPSFLYLEYNRVVYHRLPYYWVGEMEKFCIRAADQLVSPSAYLVGELRRRMNLDGLHIPVVRNPLDVNGEPPMTRFQPNKVVFFGKLTPQKGCLELLAWFSRLWSDGQVVRLFLVGGGQHYFHPEGRDMADVIRKKYRDRMDAGLLHLTGRIRPEELSDHLADARVIVVPSLVDNLPYTVLEAMARGKVVLASRQGGQAEVIADGADGFLFDHDDPDSFLERLRYILSLPEVSLRQIGYRAYEKVKREFSFSAILAAKQQVLPARSGEKFRRGLFPFAGGPARERGPEPPVPVSPSVQRGQPLLSVVIPFYNMGAYVEEALRSLREASWRNLEILLVDDGSEEPASRDILLRLEATGTLRVIRQANQGLAMARNAGAREARGEYLAFLDPDDTVEPAYYEKAIAVMEACRNVHFVGCWARYFGKASGCWPAFTPEPPYLLVHNLINSSALVCRREAFVAAGWNDAAMVYGMEDYESVVHLVAEGWRGVALPEPLWNYRVRKGSMARSFTTDKQLYLYRLIAGKHAALFDAHGAELACLLNANGPGISIDNPTLISPLSGNGRRIGRLKQALLARAKRTPWLRRLAIQIKKHIK